MANNLEKILKVMMDMPEFNRASLPKPEKEPERKENMETKPLEKKQDVEIVRDGTQIILPPKMGYPEAIDTLNRKMQQDETIVSIHEEVDSFPLDGAHAFIKVLQKRYGWADAVPTPGFFGPRPPQTVNLEVGHNTHIQIVWGTFQIPGIDGTLQTSVHPKDGRMIFLISGSVRQKQKAEIASIAQEVRDYVKEHSVYKGKAILLKTNDDGSFNFNNPPSFLDLSRVNEEELIFSTETRELVNTSLFVPIEKTEMCRKFKIPLKRNILLEGKYGTGKTLTAYVTAKKAEANGWTFVYLDRVTALKDAVKFARQYAPAVIFAEDIDRVVSGSRTVKVDDILNNIDGMDSKGFDLIGIFTTNDVHAIEKAMLRPGRLDAVISVTPPDAQAAEKLMRLYGRGLIPETEDLGEAAKELAGQIPAVIREVVERSKLFAISRFDGKENKMQLSGQDLVLAARSMKNHLNLMAPVVEPEETTIEHKVGTALGQLVSKGVASTLNGTKEKINEIHDWTQQ